MVGAVFTVHKESLHLTGMATITLFMGYLAVTSATFAHTDPLKHCLYAIEFIIAF